MNPRNPEAAAAGRKDAADSGRTRTLLKPQAPTKTPRSLPRAQKLAQSVAKGLDWSPTAKTPWQLLLLTLILLTLLPSCTNSPKTTTPPTTPIPQKTYLNHAPGVQYLGKESCKPCHADKFNTFVHSEMGRSLKKAKLTSSAANFESVKPIYDKFSDLYYLPFHQGEDLYLKEFRLQGKDTVHTRTEQIAYIVGSGQHTNSHFIEENGYLYQAPLTWYAQDGKWDLPPGFENGHNSRFTRSIELECMTCHNAMPEFDPGSDNRFIKIPEGIDCERCHGPGSAHITEKQSGSQLHLIDGIDYTIVHPGKLPVERQFDICQRCHLQGTAVPAEGKTFMDFRPGMNLSDYINIFIPRYPDSLSNFIMASHPDRLRMSQCFIQTQANPKFVKPMTCTTCHNPHLSIKTLGVDHYKQVCQGCHAPASASSELAGDCTAPAKLRLANGDNCVKCHMPTTGSSDIPHVRITDHFIRKPDGKSDGKSLLSPEELQKQKEFFRLACRTQTQPSTSLMAEGYLTQYEQFTAKPWLLDSANALVAKAMKTEGEGKLLRILVRLRYLQSDFAALTKIAQSHAPNTVTDAWTAYRIGEAWQQTAQLPQAIQWFQRANQLAPGQLKFKNKLAAALINNQQVDEALTILNELVGTYSKDPAVLNNRGYASVLKNDFPAAEKDFRKALDLDPDSEIAMANLASLYLNTGKPAEAKRFTTMLLKRAPDNPQYQKLKQALGM
jgi:predicted CXXCH cytochrome family protein